MTYLTELNNRNIRFGLHGLKTVRLQCDTCEHASLAIRLMFVPAVLHR